ncbi:unnamed protein product [Rhizoctonia solani]|uniref:DUF3835 domain-containing protein n=1 Tax=Rhizoctonia solani TaxID=456999 RepID=A0A8H3GY47_9AGAM|nr:unnamed protein product [Rhizoctonia solani]
MSTTTPEGKARIVGASKQEALRALLNSLVSNGQMTISDDTNVDKLAEKLDELLASKGGLDAYTNIPRDDQGRPLNEEGLPIMEIIEPVTNVNESSTTRPPPVDIASPSISVSGQTPLSPLPNWALSPAALAARRQERDRILDMLEREEEEEFALEAATAVAHEPTNRDSVVPHSVPTTPPRTLGQAVRASNPGSRPTVSLPISSNNEESSRPSGDSVVRASQEPLTTRKPKKQKSVSFVDPSSNDRDNRLHTPKPELDWGDVIPVQLDSRKPGPAKGYGVMKELVVERPMGQSDGVANRVADSDDENEDEELNETHNVPEDEESETEVPKGALGQLETSDDESDVDPGDPTQTIDIDDTDFDEAMLQREIALAYYARRNQIGAGITSGPLFDSAAMNRTADHDEGEGRSDGGAMETDSSRFRGLRLPGDPQTLINSAVQFGRLVDGELLVDDIADKEVEASVDVLAGGDDTVQEDMTDKTIELLRRGDTYASDDSGTTGPKSSAKHTPRRASGKISTAVLSGSRPTTSDPTPQRSSIKQQATMRRVSPHSSLATSLPTPAGNTSLPRQTIPPPPTVDQPMIIESGFGFDPAFQVAPRPKPSVAKTIAPMSEMVKERIMTPSPESVVPKKTSRFVQDRGSNQLPVLQASTSPTLKAPTAMGSGVLARTPNSSSGAKHSEPPKQMSRFRAERSGWM